MHHFFCFKSSGISAGILTLFLFDTGNFFSQETISKLCFDYARGKIGARVLLLGRSKKDLRFIDIVSSLCVREPRKSLI